MDFNDKYNHLYHLEYSDRILKNFSINISNIRESLGKTLHDK